MRMRSALSLPQMRDRVATVVVVCGIAGLVVVSALVVALAAAGDRAQTSNVVFAAIVPLVSTWVGTVLAFYFTRDNYEAASRLQVTRPAPTQVTAAMIPRNQILPQRTVADATQAAGLSLKTLAEEMKAERHSRLPIFDGAGAVLYVVHEADINALALKAGGTADTLDQTLSQLLADETLKASVTAFAAVAFTADIAEARAKLRSDGKLRDVFVTTTGAKGDLVLGWLTSSDLARVA